MSVLSAEFEPVVPTNERPQTLALGRVGTGIGSVYLEIILHRFCASPLASRKKSTVTPKHRYTTTNLR